MSSISDSPSPCSSPPTPPPPSAPPPPASAAEAAPVIAAWILAGLRPSQIAAKAREKSWTLEPAEIAAATDAALAEILADGAARARIELAKAMSRLGELFTRALAMSDIKTALSVQKEITRTAAAAAAAELMADDDQGEPLEDLEPPASPARTRKTTPNRG